MTTLGVLLLVLSACAPPDEPAAHASPPASAPTAGAAELGGGPLPGLRPGEGPAGVFRDQSDPDFVPIISPAHMRPEDEQDEEPAAPELSPSALALVATWSEPRVVVHDGLQTWTWQAGDETWELRVRGTPTFSDDDTSLVWVAERDGLRLVHTGPAGETVLQATCMSDGRPELQGTIDGRPAGSEALRAELASVLPAIAAHTGIVSDHRLETALQHDGLHHALDEVARLTSSLARLNGYDTVLRELDEPATGQVAAVLRHAAKHLPADRDMRDLLLEVADLSLDERSLVNPLLDAAATIDDDEALCDVLSLLLDRSDEVAPATVAKVLRLAASVMESDAAMGRLMEEAAFWSMASKATRVAWIAALETIEADGPLARAIEGLLGTGDTPPAECILAIHAATARIETESVRAQALASIHVDELADAAVGDAFAEAVAGLQEGGVRAELLVSLLKRPKAGARLAALWLAAARGLTPDGRLGSVLSAVPDAYLADPAVKEAFLSLATTLWSSADRDVQLRRVPIDPPR